MNDIEQLIVGGAKIIDVRTPMEFMAGNAPGSVNIPLHEIPDRLHDFKNIEGPLVLCCQSGNRSGQACAYLGTQGIECHNGGSWLNINFILSQPANN